MTHRGKRCFPSRFTTASVDFVILNFSILLLYRQCGSDRNACRACDFTLAGCVRPRQQPEGLAASAEPDARNAPDLALRPRLRLTRSEIAIHEFACHRHHDQSKNPAHHTIGSKLTPRRAVLKFNLNTIHRPIIETDGVSPDDISRCSLSSLTASAVLARLSFPLSAR